MVKSTVNTEVESLQAELKSVKAENKRIKEQNSSLQQDLKAVVKSYKVMLRLLDGTLEALLKDSTDEKIDEEREDSPKISA